METKTLKIRKCRIAVVDLQSIDLKDCPKFSDGEYNFFAWEDAHIYEYEAPEGFEYVIGFGQLFVRSWCLPDTMSHTQAQDEHGNWQNI